MAHQSFTAFLSPKSNVATALALALAVTGCKGGGNKGASELRPDQSPPVQIGSVVAKGREVPRALSLTGTLQADEQSNVTPLVPGRVQKVMVEIGQHVDKDAPMVELRTTDYRLARESAQAALDQARAHLGLADGQASHVDPTQLPDVLAAKANMDLADDNLSRTEQLSSSGAVSAAELQGARQRAAAARQQYAASLNGARGAVVSLQNAHVALDQARQNLSDSVVRAPFAGEIAERHVAVGEFVAPQQPVVTLVRSDPLRLRVQIPQEDMSRVHDGQDVDVHVDAFPNQVFHGKVRYVGASIGASNRSLTAEAVVPNADGKLRPGLFATVRLLLGGTQTMVSLPPSAVLSESGVHRVFVIDGDHVEERVVTIANQTDDSILISDEVHPNEHAATGQLDQLGDGSHVTVH